MAKKKKSGFGLMTIVAFAVVVVGLVLVIVGYTADWVKYSGQFGDNSGDVSIFKLSDLAEGFSESDGFGAMNAFAIITFVAMIVSACGYVVSAIIRLRILKLVTALAGVVTVVCAVVALITSITFAGDFMPSFSLGSIAKAGGSIAVGPILMLIGGVLGGAAAAVGAMKK